MGQISNTQYMFSIPPVDDVYWTTSVSVDDPGQNPKPVPLQPILKQASDETPSHSPATQSDPWVLNWKCDPDPDSEQGPHSVIGRSATHTSPGTGEFCFFLRH